MTAAKFSTEWEGNVLVWNCQGLLTSLTEAVPLESLEHELPRLRGGECAGVVVDLHGTAYVGSLMLEALRILWTELHGRGLRMAVCGVSPVVMEILQMSRFDTLWPICGSRAEAIQKVRTPAESS